MKTYYYDISQCPEGQDPSDDFFWKLREQFGTFDSTGDTLFSSHVRFRIFDTNVAHKIMASYYNTVAVQFLNEAVELWAALNLPPWWKEIAPYRIPANMRGL